MSSSESSRTHFFMSFGETHGISPPQNSGRSLLGVEPPTMVTTRPSGLIPHGDLSDPINSGVLQYHIGIEPLRDRVADQGRTFLLEQLDQPLLLGDEGVDLSGFAIEEGTICSDSWLGNGMGTAEQLSSMKSEDRTRLSRSIANIGASVQRRGKEATLIRIEYAIAEVEKCYTLAGQCHLKHASFPSRVPICCRTLACRPIGSAEPSRTGTETGDTHVNPSSTKCSL